MASGRPIAEELERTKRIGFKVASLQKQDAFASMPARSAKVAAAADSSAVHHDDTDYAMPDDKNPSSQ